MPENIIKEPRYRVWFPAVNAMVINILDTWTVEFKKLTEDPSYVRYINDINGNDNDDDEYYGCWIGIKAIPPEFIKKVDFNIFMKIFLEHIKRKYSKNADVLLVQRVFQSIMELGHILYPENNDYLEVQCACQEIMEAGDILVKTISQPTIVIENVMRDTLTTDPQLASDECPKCHRISVYRLCQFCGVTVGVSLEGRKS